MTKISIYNKDTDVRGNDKWIGSDAQNQNRTKNFTPDNVAAYFNENQVIDLGVELRYFYDTLDPLQERVYGSITFETEIGPQVNFSSISTFILSKYTMGHTDVSQFLDFLIGSNVLLSRSNNINMFGYYKIDNIEPYLPDPNFFVVTLTFENGNGYMKEDEDYFISLVQFEQTIPNVPTKTSDLINDGEDGVHPFITAEDVPTPTLQSVTDEGDTTTTTVYLNGGAISESINEQAVFAPAQVSTVNLNSGSGATLDSTGKLALSPDGLVSSLFAADNITQSITLQSPNKAPGSYTLATTDDIPAVTGFVPYTGANQNVDLGEYELKAGQLTLDTTPTGTSVVGTTQWNDATGVSETKLKGGNVVLKNGVDLVARVVNKVTPNATLLRANYTAVRISGAQGQRLAVAYAQANNDNNSADTLGLVYEDIATNQEGFIMTMGQFEEINTTGSLQGETWSDGDVLYLSPTTAGRITNIKPTGLTGHIVVMGYVEYAHANHGKIYVKIMNGWELDELHNVYINSPLNNDGLFYDSADSLWKNKTIAAALGYTPENVANKSTSTSLGTSDTLYPTQNAVKVYADTKFTLPSLTSGSVLFSNGTTIAQDNANLFWDDTNNRLGIGTNAPAAKFTIQQSNQVYAPIDLVNFDIALGIAANTSLISGLDFKNFNSTGQVRLMARNNQNDYIAINTYGSSAVGTLFGLNRSNINAIFGQGSFDSTKKLVIGTFNVGDLILGTNNTERMRIFANGNVGINTTTDAGFRLDVNGTARVQGELTVNGVQIGLGGGAQANNCRVGTSALASNTTGGSNTAIGAYSFFALQTGSNNTAIGRNAASSIVSNASISAVGAYAFLNLNSGNDSIGFGLSAGRFLADGTTSATSFSNGVYLGNLCRVSANNATNEIVIGNSAIGIGSNSVVLGNDSITKTALKGNVLINTTTDGGFRLDVNGTARVQGELTVNGVQIGLGTGAISSNTRVGSNALNKNTTGSSNTAIGVSAANENTTGSNNSFFGLQAGFFNTTGGSNVGVGRDALRDNIGGSLNIAIGTFAGRFIADGVTNMTVVNNSVYIGAETRGNANSQTNQIVIGYQAIGIGSNSVVLGNDSITKTALKGNVLINTTTDAGFKLDVNGTARVQGQLTITTGGASITGNVSIASSSLISASRYQCSTGLFAFGNTFLYGAGGQPSPAVASGSRSIFLSDASWNQSSGTADFASFRITGAINQTGTATGITRGLYIAPTLTAAADWRAIEVSNGGAYINTTSVQASAILQADSTTQGFLPPRMTTTQKNAIATPAAGLVVYDTTLNQLCTYDGTWGDSPFYQQSLRGVRFFTDFDSSSSFDNLVSIVGGVAAATARLNNNVPNQTANQIGIAQYQTGTAVTGVAMHITEASPNAQQFQFGGGTWMYESYIEVSALSDETTGFRFTSGFGNLATAAGETHGVFFTYDEGGTANGTIASPNWQCVTTVGAVRTLTTTSVAVTTNWVKLRIIVNADATEVKFYIDGNLVATHTTNIPVFPTRVKVLQKLAKTVGTGNGIVYCDYIFYENNLTTLR